MALFKHKLTGEIIDAPAHYALNPVLGKNLIPVDAEAPAKPEKKQKKEAPVAIPVEVEAEEGETPTIETNEE
jgi:hypothetical protein